MNDDNLDKMIDNVGSAKELAAFVAQYATDVERSPDDWENLTVPMFLEAMSAWISDSINNPDSVGHRILHEELTWKTLARILLAAGVYE